LARVNSSGQAARYCCGVTACTEKNSALLTLHKILGISMANLTVAVDALIGVFPNTELVHSKLERNPHLSQNFGTQQ